MSNLFNNEHTPTLPINLQHWIIMHHCRCTSTLFQQ